jgi:hypothetical protein
VLDYVTLWPYFNPLAQMTPATPLLDREIEIYSDPFGTADDSGAIRLPYTKQHPTGAIDRIRVYAGSMINAIEVRYYGGGGPMGVSRVSGHSVSPPNGCTVWVGPHKVSSVDGSSGMFSRVSPYTRRTGMLRRSPRAGVHR